MNKANLLEKIAELVNEEKIQGISDLRDESDKSGMRVVIELKRGEVAEVILNNLYKHTAMQDTFGMNMVALVDGQPRLLNLKEMMDAFLAPPARGGHAPHGFELRKARERGHILEGLAVALVQRRRDHRADQGRQGPAEANGEDDARAWPSTLVDGDAGAHRCRKPRGPEGLDPAFGLTREGYELSDVQAQAILDLRLQRLTGLEQDKTASEYNEVMKTIADLLDILSKPERDHRIIRDELTAIKEQFGDKRRTEIVQARINLKMEDLIASEDVVVTLSHAGYIKSQPLVGLPRPAPRRARQVSATKVTKEEDFVEQLFIANTHATILCFSNLGRVYWLKVYDVPQAGRGARGKPIVNLLPLDEGRKGERHPAGARLRPGRLRVHGDLGRHREKDRIDRVFAPAARWHHRP